MFSKLMEKVVNMWRQTELHFSRELEVYHIHKKEILGLKYTILYMLNSSNLFYSSLGGKKTEESITELIVKLIEIIQTKMKREKNFVQNRKSSKTCGRMYMY